MAAAFQMNGGQQCIQPRFKTSGLRGGRYFNGDDHVVDQESPGQRRRSAVAATLFTGTEPAQARDGRNAALIGGLVVGTLVGGAVESAGQPSYQSYQGYDDGYDYPASRRYYGGYLAYRSHDDGYYAPRYYRGCDDDYQNAGWDVDD